VFVILVVALVLSSRAKSEAAPYDETEGKIVPLEDETYEFYIISSQKYLKFIRPVILNSFQDLTLCKNRDAEPSSA